MDAQELTKAIRNTVQGQGIIFLAPGTAKEWTNMPAAETEFFGISSIRSFRDLSRANLARIVTRVSVAPAANAKLKIQYSLNDSTWIDLCTVTMPATANFTNIGAWTEIPDAAKTEVYLRIVGKDGDGATDPTFNLTTLQVKL